MVRPYYGYHILVTPYLIQQVPLFAEQEVKNNHSSKLVWDCHQSLMQLAKHNIVQLIWVPGHEGVVGKETANQLAKLGSECPFIGPKPACSVSVGVAKKAVGDWTNRDHKQTLGILNRTHTRTLCQKNGGTVKTKQKSVTVGG
jgi:hypothetical protein